MNNYKNTLNLPKTNFPMKGNLPNTEPNTLKKWKKNNIYKIIRNKKKEKKMFLLHDGPPYANGKIHIGHAINKVLKDIIIKSKTLSGFNTPYVPFWDCHGLPIEHKIEKKFGKPGKNITHKEFRKICKNYVIKQVKNQKSDFIRLGVFADWDNAKLTMHPKLEYNVINVLQKIIENKYLYKGLKPVHWCLDCESALAEAEVEYYEKYSTSIITTFKKIKNEKIKNIFFKNKSTEINIKIAIWTTTPWTIPANRAIAVHPEFQYQLIEFKKKFVIIAKKLVKSVMEKLNIHEWNIIDTILGKKLKNTTFKHPFLDLEIPIVLSKHVTLDAGTGIVHIAPDYGYEDFHICNKYNIPITNIINSKGEYSNCIHPKINGKKIFNIEKTIIKLLKQKKSLLYKNKIKHIYPHCWRHKTPVIFRTTEQWFINIENSKLKEKSIHSIKKVKWTPRWGYNHMKNMIHKRPDWCISRQRTWGIPITVFTHKKTGKLHPNTINILEKIKKIIKYKGSESWWNIKKKDIIKKDHEKYNKSTDIIDVWFESGCTHTLKVHKVKNNKKNINMYLEGLDQYRGWFMSSLIISQIINKKAPYEKVLTHGFTIDQKGQKMSKSIGNTITPYEIIKSFGADILRLWIASTNYTNDIIVSKTILEQISDHYRKIRNTSRFLLANIYDFDPNVNKIHYSKMIILDKWIISKTKKIQKKIIKLYENFKFHKIVQKIIQFCSIDMGSFYLDIIKDRQYTLKKNSFARRSCQTAIYYIIEAMVRWISPILPFTADEIWEYLPKNKNKSIFTEKWFTLLSYLPEDEIINHKNWKKLIIIKTEINKLIEKKRIKKEIKNSLEISITLYINKNLYRIFYILKNEIKFMLLVSEVKIKKYRFSNKNTYSSKKINELNIKIKKYLGIKCPRCWHYFNKIRIKNQDKNICNRCNENIYEKGEKRIFL